MDFFIREMTDADRRDVRRILFEGIATGNATFESEAPSWEHWDAGHIRSCRLVAERDGKILGWAALSPFSGRPVYSGVAEVSIYVERDARGLGVGDGLMARLVTESEREGFWTLQAGIFPDNRSSLALHEKHGFRVVGCRERLGRMSSGAWRDVLLLERRSGENRSLIPICFCIPEQGRGVPASPVCMICRLNFPDSMYIMITDPDLHILLPFLLNMNHGSGHRTHTPGIKRECRSGDEKKFTALLQGADHLLWHEDCQGHCHRKEVLEGDLGA